MGRSSRGSQATTPRRKARLGRLRAWLQKLSWIHYSSTAAVVVSLGMSCWYLKRPVTPDEGLILLAEKEYDRGNGLYREGEVALASLSFRKAVSFYPRHVYAWTNLGITLRELGKVNESVEAHEKALALWPRPKAYYNLGVSYQMAGDSSKAVDAYQSALELDANSPLASDVLFNMGVAYQDQGAMHDAFLAYERALSIDKGNKGAACNLCNILQFQHKLDEAEGCYRKVIKNFPDYDRAYVNLGGTLYAKGELEEAAELYGRALEINPKNSIASHALSALQGHKLDAASPAYLAELFDSYSANFDASLLGLQYRSPELLRAAVDDHLRAEADAGRTSDTSNWRLLDAGCGTGLAGPLFKNISGHLTGVDISRRMVQKASERGIYNELTTGDMTELLVSYASDPFDLIVSADVLVYYGRLDYVLITMRKALRPKQGGGKGGLLAFTLEALTDQEVERGDGVHHEEWTLRPSGRYAHARAYVEKVLLKHAFSVLDLRDIVPRYDKGEAIPGYLVIAERAH